MVSVHHMLPERGPFAWAARDLTPEGTSFQGRLAPILAESSPFPPLRSLAFRLLTLLFCSLHPNSGVPHPNQPKSPCDTLDYLTKSALVASFQSCLSSLSTPQTLLPVSSSFSAFTLMKWNSRIPLSSFGLRTRMQIWTRVRTSNRTLRQTSRHP